MPDERLADGDGGGDVLNNRKTGLYLTDSADYECCKYVMKPLSMLFKKVNLLGVFSRACIFSLVENFSGFKSMPMTDVRFNLDDSK